MAVPGIWFGVALPPLAAPLNGRRKGLAIPPLAHIRDDLRVHELADGVADGALLRREQALHGKEVEHRLPLDKLVKQPLEVIYEKDPMPKVMQKFDNTNSWNLPVLSVDNKFIGFMINYYK